MNKSDEGIEIMSNNTTFLDVTAVSATTVIPLDPSALAQYCLFIVFGTIALIASVIVLFALFRPPNILAKKYVLITGLTITDVMTGVALGAGGSVRLRHLLVGDVTTKATNLECFSEVYDILLILVNHLLGVFTLAIAFERFMAVALPLWYRNTWNPRKAYGLAVALFLYGIGATGVGIVLSVIYPPSGLNRSCSAGPAFGNNYTIFYKITVTFFVVIAVCAQMASLFIGQWRMRTASMNQESAQYRKRFKQQVQLTIMMTIVATLALVLVIIPNCVITLLYGFHIGNLDAISPSFPYFSVLMCINSALNLPIYAVFMKELRFAFCSMVRCGNAALVEPMSTGGKVTAVRTHAVSNSHRVHED